MPAHYSTCHNVPEKAIPNFMPGIAPITMDDAKLFAERYLEPAQRGDFLADHKDGKTLQRWMRRLDEETRHTIFVDCLLSHADVPYDRRLEAIDANPRRAILLASE